MHTIAALYHFARFPDPAALRGPLLQTCLQGGVTGTLLLAPEGINGTVSGPGDGIAATLAHIRTLPGCDALEWKQSQAATPPFTRMKVRLKREIVTLGLPGIDPLAATGHYVAAQDWNALIAAPDVVVIDTRNDYEVALGSFAGAVNTGTRRFGEFPAWWQANRDRFEGKTIAMFCTGGIRCEKSTNYLLSQGVTDVWHLKGGILKYLEEVPQTASLWHGECFVFDARVSVGHGLIPGGLTTCPACRRPLTDTAHPLYEPGAACGQCHHEHSEADRARFRERHRQLALARARANATGG